MFGFLFRLVGRIIGFGVKVTLFVGALAVVAGGTMYALFDAEQYKRIVTQRLVDITGRAVTVEGPATLELTIPPQVVLNDVRIRNSRWGSRPDMARIRQVQIKINPLAAVSGNSGATDIRLEGVDLVLETGPGGMGNWEIGPIASGGATAAGAGLQEMGMLGALRARWAELQQRIVGAQATASDAGARIAALTRGVRTAWRVALARPRRLGGAFQHAGWSHLRRLGGRGRRRDDCHLPRPVSIGAFRSAVDG